LEFNESSKENYTLVGSEIDFSVWMHTESQWGFTWYLCFKIFNVLLVAKRWWAFECYTFAFNEGEEFSLIK